MEGWRPTLSKPDMQRPADDLPQNIPDHMKLMFTDPLGIQMIVVGATMQVVGTLVIRKLVNIRY